MAEHETAVAERRLSQTKSEYDQLEKTERASIEEVESDPVETSRILRKIDLRVLPLLILLYTLTFLDRVNIGNARLWNLEKDLKMTGNQYNLIVMSMLPTIIDIHKGKPMVAPSANLE